MYNSLVCFPANWTSRVWQKRISLHVHLTCLYCNMCIFSVQVCLIKDDLSGLGPKMEEFRSVCRQLQSQLKKIPDCSETPFETEADALVDSWLDVSASTGTVRNQVYRFFESLSVQ